MGYVSVEFNYCEHAKAMFGRFPNKSLFFINKIKRVYFLFVSNISLPLLKLIRVEKVDIATDFLKNPHK